MAFPPKAQPPSWSRVDVGRYSEKISKAGVLPPAPRVSGEEGAHLLQSPRLRSLDGKSTNQSVSAQGVQEPQPSPFQVLPSLVHCLSRDSCVGMSTLSASLQSTKGLCLATVHIQSKFQWQVRAPQCRRPAPAEAWPSLVVVHSALEHD